MPSTVSSTMAYRLEFFKAVCLALLASTEAFETNSLVVCYRGSFLQINDTKQWLDNGSPTAPQRVNVKHPDSHLSSSSFLARSNILVFGDKGTKTIFLHQDEPSISAVFAHVGVSEGIGELAVDWVNYNMYWTDGVYSWIGLQAFPRNISRIANNDKQRIVVEKSLKKPRGLAVSPQQRYLFWTDHGDPPRIERSNLKGEDRRTLVWMAIKSPVSIAVDPTTSNLYWVDLARATIETCDFQGQGRRVVLQRVGFSLTGLTVFEGSVIYTEANQKNIHAVSKVTGVQSARVLDLDVEPEGLTVFSESSQPYSASQGACESYGCSHICIDTSQGPECLCDGGYRLAANRKTCTVSPTDAVWKSIIYTDGTNIRAFPVTTFNSYRYIDIEVTHLTSGVNVTFLATDSQSNTLFFVTGRHIRRKSIGGVELTVTSASNDITGLVLDTEDRKLIWTVEEEGQIQTSGISTNSEPAELYRALRAPGDIAIDVKNRRLFWVSSTAPSRIETGAVSGGSVTVLVGTNLAQPQRLTYDPQRNRLYWTEDGQIGSIVTDGTGRLIQSLVPLPTYIGVAVFKDYLAWTATTTNSVNMSVSVIQDTGNIAEPITFTIPNITMVTDIVVFDADEYKMDTDGCVKDNGGCDQICFPQDTGNTCGCKFGFRFHEDEKRCISDVVERDFNLVIDGTHNAIYQVLTNNAVHGVNVLTSNTPSLVRFDWLGRQAVWYDGVRRLIMKAFLDGSEERVVIGTEGFTVNGMDIDPSTSNIYYSMTSSTNAPGYIRVVTRDGSVSRTLVNTTKEPGSVIVHPKKGLLLWGEDVVIKQADMSGARVSTLVSSGLSSVSDLSLDSAGETLYIADSVGDAIKSFDLTTRTMRTLRQSTKENPRVLATKGDNLLYISSAGRSIKVLNRRSGVELEPFADFAEFGQLTEISVYVDGTIVANEECSISNGECSSLCLPTSSGRMCACADGINFSEGESFCENDKMCPADIKNGELASDCLRYPNSVCTFTCNQGYVTETSSKLTCLSTGQWDAALENLCIEEPVKETMVIVGVAVGCVVLVVIVVIFICWKRGACRSRKPPFRSHPMSRDPVITVTKEEEIYAEINERPEEQERYTSFGKISPNPIGKELAEHSEIKNPAYAGYLNPQNLPPLPHPRPPDIIRSVTPEPDYERMHPQNDGYIDLQNWAVL